MDLWKVDRSGRRNWYVLFCNRGPVLGVFFYSRHFPKRKESRMVVIKKPALIFDKHAFVETDSQRLMTTA